MLVRIAWSAVTQNIPSLDPMIDVTCQVVDELNRAHGLTFALHSRCPAGLQDGAWRLTDPDGRLAILKWRPDGSAVQMVHRARTVARLRAAGYPTPAWLAAGATSDGCVYYVQDFVPGMPCHPLTAAAADLLVNVLERHAGLDPDPGRDRNEHVKRMAFDESADSPRQTARQLGPPGHALVAHYEELLDRHRAVQFPRGDLVHGDFNTCNVLIHQGRVSGVIDIEALGSGTRVIDYACLLRESYVDDYDLAVRRTIRGAGEAIAGPGVLAVCVSATAFDIVGFKLRHEPAHIHRTLARLHRLADDLAGPP